MRETWVRSLGGEDPLEKETTTHSSILAWRIPWTEEPGGLQSMGLQRVGHDWAASLSLSLHPPTDIDYPHYFPVHGALSYLFYLVPIKTEWDMWLTLPRMVWKHIFWWDFCWVSSNSLVDGTDLLNTQVLEGSKCSHWHVLPYILPVPQELHSLHSFHKRSCAWFTSKVSEWFENISFQGRPDAVSVILQ